MVRRMPPMIAMFSDGLWFPIAEYCVKDHIGNRPFEIAKRLELSGGVDDGAGDVIVTGGDTTNGIDTTFEGQLGHTMLRSKFATQKERSDLVLVQAKDLTAERPKWCNLCSVIVEGMVTRGVALDIANKILKEVLDRRLGFSMPTSPQGANGLEPGTLPRSFMLRWAE